jgi:4'-phosphopantetheinyl transferase
MTDAPAGADLWLLEEEAIEELAARTPLAELATAEERARYDRLRQEQVRRRFVGARLLSRHALSAYADVPPEAWRFRMNRHGRPDLDPNPWNLVFNLSHTAGLVACVITRGRACGVDVERSPARPEAMALADRWFAPEERAYLEETPPEARGDRFLEYWVLKEAFTKALGEGLTRGFDTFRFNRLPADTITVADVSAGEEECARWQFELLRVGAHVLGVAIRREPSDAGSLPLRVRDLAEHPNDPR